MRTSGLVSGHKLWLRSHGHNWDEPIISNIHERIMLHARRIMISGIHECVGGRFGFVANLQ